MAVRTAGLCEDAATLLSTRAAMRFFLVWSCDFHGEPFCVRCCNPGSHHAGSCYFRLAAIASARMNFNLRAWGACRGSRFRAACSTDLSICFGRGLSQRFHASWGRDVRTLEAAFCSAGRCWGRGPKERRLQQNPSLLAIVRSWQEGRQKSVPPFGGSEA